MKLVLITHNRDKALESFFRWYNKEKGNREG